MYLKIHVIPKVFYLVDLFLLESLSPLGFLSLQVFQIVPVNPRGQEVQEDPADLLYQVNHSCFQNSVYRKMMNFTKK